MVIIRWAMGGLVVSCLLAGMGCSMLTQSPFARTASDTGATFAAAATTLRYAHEGKLTRAYACASFVNYRSQIGGLDQQLPAQAGAPDAQTVRRLLDLAGPAQQALEQPCLADDCDWRAQVAALQRASEAFRRASEA